MDLMRRRIERHQADAAPYEKIRKFHILDSELTLEAGELTPTLKVKRKQVVQKFAARIEALYADEAEQEPPRS
jgi:long-chain acyl-CoA synthetase